MHNLRASAVISTHVHAGRGCGLTCTAYARYGTSLRTVIVLLTCLSMDQLRIAVRGTPAMC